MQKLLNFSLKHNFACALFIIFFTSLVRFIFIATGQINLSPDEAQYWDWSRHLQLSYYSKPALIAWVNYFWTSIFGATELGVRFGALFNSILVQLILYFGITKLFKKPNVALLSLIIANTMPIFLAASIVMTTDSHLLLAWVCAFFSFYALSAKPNNKKYLIIFTLSVTYGTLAKYTMLAFFATMLLFYIILYLHKILEKSFVINTLLAFIFGTILSFVPILIWNIQNNFVGVKHILTLAGLAPGQPKPLFRLDTLPDYLLSQTGIASPWWLVMMIFGTYLAYKVIKNFSSSKEELVKQALLFSGFVPLWFGFLVWSLNAKIYPNWSSMSYVAGIILAAYVLEKIVSGEYRQKIKKVTYACLYVSFAAFFIIYAQNLIYLPKNFDPTLRLKGYSDLGQKIEELTQNLADKDKIFYFSDSYGLTSILSFYIPTKPNAYCAVVGDRRKNQYDFWDNPEDKVGYNAVYVQYNKKAPQPEIQEMFESMEVFQYTPTHFGHEAKDFTITIFYNYNGKWKKHTENSF